MKEDDDEDSSMGATRYPCMPSQIALMQMRNRLQLAQLGKKLMKFTVMATNRELRKLSIQYAELLKDFDSEMRKAFILLARSRYYHTNLNNVVCETIGEHATIRVHTQVKHLPSARVVLPECIETENPTYPHLGIGVGGETIKETKQAWLDLLKKILRIIQVKATFEMVEASYKTSNKKMKVLQNVVIPRVNATSRYIMQELEEHEREDFYRIKKCMGKKKKDKKGEEKDSPKEIIDQPEENKRPVPTSNLPKTEPLQKKESIKLIVPDELSVKIETTIEKRVSNAINEKLLDEIPLLDKKESVASKVPEEMLEKAIIYIKEIETILVRNDETPDESNLPVSKQYFDASFDKEESVKLNIPEEKPTKIITDVKEKEKSVVSVEKVPDEIPLPMKEYLEAKQSIEKYNEMKKEFDDFYETREKLNVNDIIEEKSTSCDTEDGNAFCLQYEPDSDDEDLLYQMNETSSSNLRLSNLKQLLEQLIGILEYSETKDLRNVDIKTILQLSNETITVMKTLMAYEIAHSDVDGKAGKNKKINNIRLVTVVYPKNQLKLTSIKNRVSVDASSLCLDQPNSFQASNNITENEYNLLVLDKYHLLQKIITKLVDYLSTDQCPGKSSLHSLDNNSCFPDEKVVEN